MKDWYYHDVPVVVWAAVTAVVVLAILLATLH